MAKRKSCIAGEFVIERAESETITVYKIYDNTLGGLREVAAAVGFEINEKSNALNNGAQLIKFVNEKAGIDDKNHAVAGEFSIEKLPSGTISVYKTYANTLGGLREAAATVGFEINENSNTRQNGSKLIDFINEKKGE